MNKKFIIPGAVAIVGLVIGFGVGYFVPHGASASARGQFGSAGQFAVRPGARTGAGGFTAGQILSAANGSITIEQENGSSTEIVLVSPSTQVLKTTSGSTADLTAGTQVVVTGTSNSDGSLTAQSIQIRSAGAAFGSRSTLQQ